jgi:hypothetical protein
MSSPLSARAAQFPHLDGPMLHVTLFVELVRSQPRFAFWAALLTQALLWWLVPSLFYAAPPGNLPEVLAIGHEFQLGAYSGPPLAFWLAEGAYRVARMPGVYLLSQICVIVTFWAVFELGKAIVGIQHAVLATLLMVGVSAFAVPTPDFGPSIVAMPLVALVLLHFWRAIGENKRVYWFVLAIEIGLLLLTTYAGLILFALMLVFIGATRRGRAMLASGDPWIAGVIVAIVLFPHLIWLDASGGLIMPALRRLGDPAASYRGLVEWGRQLSEIAGVHAGSAVLIAIAVGWRLRQRTQSPSFLRSKVRPFARQFVFFFALAPIFLATLIAFLIGARGPVGGIAPHIVLSTLAVVVAAGDVVTIHRQRMVSAVWCMLLLVPPVFAAGSIAVLPWAAAVDVSVAQPARPMGRFFAETFERRTGKPLAVVAGEPRLAALVALAAPSRPHLFLDATPERTPWVTADDIKRQGAIVVWSSADTVGAPPAEIKARFPDLVPEVPQSFARTVQGRLPPFRVGWGMIRPRSTSPANP